MSNVMSNEGLVKWAKAMGFPGADDPAFKANVRRLITPQTKTMLSHLATHVRPANEVTHMRKQVLAYKLRMENNLNGNSLKRFESVADYEASLKKSALEAKMVHCNMQAEKRREDIKSLSAKLVDKGERLQSQKMEEKEKMDKLRLLRAKRKELEQQVDIFKQMDHEINSVMQPNYTHQRTTDPWELDVQKYCASLVRGQEIAMMCEQLKEALKTDISKQIRDKDTSNGSEESMFHKVIEEYQCGLRVKLLEFNEEYVTKLEELEARKQDLIVTLTSSEDVCQVAQAGVLETFMESGRLDDIGKAAENDFMMEWLKNNSTRFDNSLNASYVKEREEVAELDHLISRVQDEISFLTSFPATKLRKSLTALVSKMNVAAMAACLMEETPSTVIDKILTDLPELIDFFRKTPIITKRCDPGTHSIQNCTDFKLKLSKTRISQAFASFEVSVREKITDSTSMVKHVQAKVAREESKIGIMLNNLTEMLHIINQNQQYINCHLACWEKSSLTKVIFNSPDYQDLLTRLKNLRLERA